ncbi:ADP-ribosylglycohydrolase family protein [Paeniglutamicibacter sulfureus]|uniref:ADP-ribosylglycohydrolase family protein n=1 Tax=Paeniglutamicibacter sulfureus TaxID=43666 RepID=UPI0026667502|nr:ADP-ribosylglycohydrolase family protein [Paeniglutamicibacter sulfureus]MDO2935850.1 ADP-ribosylglycohydrolase family protein [Paeniglutamicibacter sulfureus]
MSESTDQYALPADYSDRVFGVLLAAADGAAHARDGADPGETETLALYLLDGLLEALEWANEGVSSDEAACMWLAALRWYKLVNKSFPAGAPEPQPRWIDEAFDGAPDFAPGDSQNLLALDNADMASVGRPLFPQADTTGVLTRAAFMALLPRVDEATTAKLATDAAALTHGSPGAHRAAAAAALVVRAALESGTGSVGRWAALVKEFEPEMTEAREPDQGHEAPESEAAERDMTAGAGLFRAVTLVTNALAHTEPKAAYDALFEALGEEPDAETAAYATALLAAVQGTDAVAHRPASEIDPILDAMHDRWVKLTVGE